MSVAICEIEDYSTDGHGLGRVNGQVVFVPGGVRGDKLRINITRVKGTAAYAEIAEVLKESPHRIKNDCPAFPQCGGCAFRHISYEEELRYKHKRVCDSLKRIGGVNINSETEIIPSENKQSYRNKTSYNVSGFDVGFYKRGTHDIICAERCLLQNEKSDITARIFRNRRNRGITRINTRTGSGGILISVESSEKSPSDNAELVKSLLDVLPDLTGLVWLEKGKKTVLYGHDFTFDVMCGYNVAVSSQSFYQINREQAEKLYAKAIEFCSGAENGIDLYCGIGTLTLSLAGSGIAMTGVDIERSCITDARNNAERNGIKAKFICSDAGGGSLKNMNADFVIIDPPRGGLSREALENVISCGAKQIIYISCDPATLARDIKRLPMYTPAAVTIVDMFPRTAHVETIVLMSQN